MEKGFCSIPVERLVKADWNYKVNNEELSKKLTENIKRNGQIENIIVRDIADGKFEIVNGNHRLDTLVELGYKDVYCYNLGDISEIQAKRIAVETNETKFNSNTEILANIVADIIDEFDDSMLTLPWTQEEIDEMLGLDEVSDSEITATEEQENKYTQKIQSPIYEITGENPSICELFDNKKTMELISEIEKSNCDDDVKMFLVIAAQRHTVFNFSKIAEFYAHADAELQDLMEKSALIIIDFDKAIEYGFANIKSEAEEMISEDIGNEE